MEKNVTSTDGIPSDWTPGDEPSYEAYERLQARCPVAYSDSYGGFHSLLKHRDVTKAARDTGDVSGYAEFAPEVVDFLTVLGARAERIHLPDLGIHGNGHALIWELNSDVNVRPVLQWIGDNSGSR